MIAIPAIMPLEKSPKTFTLRTSVENRENPNAAKINKTAAIVLLFFAMFRWMMCALQLAASVN